MLKNYEILKPLIHKIDSIIDNCYRHCHIEFFHTFEYRCIHNVNHTNTDNNELFNLTISDKNLSLYEIIKKLKIARQKGFIFNEIHKLTIKIYSYLSNIKIRYYLKFRTPIMHRHFLKILSQNPEFVQANCNDRNNRFRFGCRNGYLYNNPKC